MFGPSRLTLKPENKDAQFIIKYVRNESVQSTIYLYCDVRCDESVELATGQQLEDLEGGLFLYRGMQESGKREVLCPDALMISDEITDNTTSGSVHYPATYHAQLFLPESIFDQLITFANLGRVPHITIGLKGEGFEWGDGSFNNGKKWDNKTHKLVEIGEITIVMKQEAKR